MTQGVGYEHGILKHVDLVLRVFRATEAIPSYPSTLLRHFSRASEALHAGGVDS